VHPHCRLASAVWRAFLAVLLAQALVGCATKQAALQVHAPPSEELRASLGTIGVMASDQEAPFHYQVPKGKGKSAARGAWEGFLVGGMIMNAMTDVIDGGGGDVEAVVEGSAVAIGAAAIIAATPIGTITGAIRGVPAAKRRAAETILTNAMVEFEVQGLLHEAVLKSARQLQHFTIIPWDHAGNEPNSSTATNQSINTILEVSISNFSLRGDNAVNPPLTLSAHATARLINAENGLELYSCQETYTSAQACKFARWADHSGLRFREEVPRICDALASKIVDKLFRYPAEPRPGQQNLNLIARDTQ
jgi:hypothetical protein